MAMLNGQTQDMINILVEDVIDGSPTNIVFTHNLDFAVNHLKPRVECSLRGAGMDVKSISPCILECEGSTIMFVSVKQPVNVLRGLRGSHYVDHFCVEEYEQLEIPHDM